MPFQGYLYSVGAVASDGHGRSGPSDETTAFCTSAPNQLSLGAPVATWAGGESRQTFTVGQPGQLMGIELASQGASDYFPPPGDIGP